VNLPNSQDAVIPLPKLQDYLLDPEHPQGGGKAVFFLAMGFHPDRWQFLADALRDLIRQTPITQTVAGRHGTKYIVEGNLMTPAGRPVRVRTVWIIEPGESNPRFVTAYPIDEAS
jgi:hypothetical protein